MLEIWLPVPGYEGLYEVSSLGAVRGLDRMHQAVNSHTKRPMARNIVGKLKKQTKDKDGYLQVRLSKNGTAKTHRVSRLVLLAFRGQGEEACHIDHNKTNNSLSNLRWGTREDNEKQKTLSGRRPCSTVGKLTCADAEEIRQLYASGSFSYKQIAHRFGVHLSTVACVVTQKTWN